MADHLCEVCAQRPAPDATICRTCTHQLVIDVASVAAYHGLAYDLDIAIAKQARFRSGAGGRLPVSSERPLMIDENASDAARALKVVLVKWARVVYRDTRPVVFGPACRSCLHGSCQNVRVDLPTDNLTAIAGWLRHRVRWMAGHPDAAHAHTEIGIAVRIARIAVDRPGDRLYVGLCDCGRGLYALAGDVWAVCRSTDHETPPQWPVQARREWMLQEAEDFVGTTAQVAGALSRVRPSRPITPSAIRGMVFRRKLRPVWADDRRRALYRLGDVLDAVAPVVTCEEATG